MKIYKCDDCGKEMNGDDRATDEKGFVFELRHGNGKRASFTVMNPSLQINNDVFIYYADLCWACLANRLRDMAKVVDEKAVHQRGVDNLAKSALSETKE